MRKLTAGDVIFFVVLFFSVTLNGQMSFSNDTIRIGEVVISRKKINAVSSGFKKITIDSASLANYSLGTLAEILSENFGFSLKSYGMGGVATPSFRGTGANHTQVTWNGININHPMLGQSDLSLFPAGMTDEIHIYYGGASMKLNSGGIGGLIDLETKPSWNKKTIFSLSPGLASFGQYSGLVTIKTGNTDFQTVTKGFFQSSDNDFRYLNTVMSSEPVWETRKNSQVSQKGFLQEFYFRKSNYEASAKFWYQSADRSLPPSMLTQQINSTENQFDQSFRTILNCDLFKGINNFSLTGAFLASTLNYSNNLASIDSRNASETFILKAGIERRISENTKLNIFFNDELSVIKSNNYSGKATSNIASVTVSAENNGSGRLSTTIILREILNNSSLLIPDISAGFQVRLVENKEYFLKTNFSRNSKLPSLNDLFWYPGGNPRLKNEYAYVYELRYEMKHEISNLLTMRYDLSVFRNNIKDMIQWRPGEFSYWSADNIGNVNSSGIESSFLMNYTFNHITSSLKAGYSFTRSGAAGTNDPKGIPVGRQLIYVPENQANVLFRMKYRKIYSSWIANFTGKRFTTVDNSKYLQEYFINNILAGVKLNMKNNSVDFNFSIDNLFDVNYQTIAYYPLPGRSYSLKILIQIIK